jgi:hypothetical protein
MEKGAINPAHFFFSQTLNTSTKMSSTISLATINAKIDALLTEVSLLRAAANSAPVAVSSPVKTVTEKKPRKKSDAPPTPWRLFTDRVRGVLSAADFKGKALGVECVQFCSSLKDENADLDSWTDELVLARRADWAPPTVSKGEAKFGKGWAKTGERRAAAKAASVSGSVVSGGDADADDAEADADAAPASTEPKKARKNPWEGLTPEQKAAKVAAMKAGRDAKKAVAADSDAAPTSPKVVVQAPPSPVVAASSSVTVTNAAAESSPDEFKGVMLGGDRYLVNLASGHCYRREKDGSQGEWAGIFHRTGGPKNNGPWIDTAVPEPSDDDELVFDE